MKKYVLALMLVFLSLFSIAPTNALEIKIITAEEQEKLQREITIEEAFNFFWWVFTDKVESSYVYIKLNFLWVEEWTELYESMQKLIYLNKVENVAIDLKKDSKMNLYAFLRLWTKIFNKDLLWNKSMSDLLSKNTTYWDLLDVKAIVEKEDLGELNLSGDSQVNEKKEIFTDVYDTLLNDHYDKESLDEIKMIDSAIEWLAKGTGDKYTTYFPPVESKVFQENLNWNYEWIGAYIDMEEPGKLVIVSPIKWSPAEQAWIKWWDIVKKVDWTPIREENSLAEVVSWIKWEAWTKVVLTVDRDGKVFDVEVVRWKIVINDLEYKLLNEKTFYIEIKSFGSSVVSNFDAAVNDLVLNHPNVDKIIFDLRNNGWGYLSEVTKMLWYFVEEGKPVAVVKYRWDVSRTYTSSGIDKVNFSKYKLVVLQNSWTASASEILIWTLRDYYKDLVIIWETSFGKGSVQSIKGYSDGSSLKYTIAKWFTWLTQTWIDWVGIEPTINLEFDMDRFNNDWVDNQLEKALQIR